ncbi:MAG: hypothetical protein BGP08_04540 [Rhizobiales bacterium 64-17]|nr:MAG: hypothetical protein BGP08_04540 [Rhizobiales bacterium 64-17]
MVMPKKSHPANEPRRYPLNLRTTAEIREKMRAAAAQSGRSLVQELEHRIENSFERDEVFTLLLGGSENGRLVQKLAFAVRDADHDWATDPRKEAELIEQIEKAVRAEGKARRGE